MPDEDGAGPGWVPVDACTLPTAERPFRLAEFAELFRRVREIERVAPNRLRLVVPETGGVVEQVRDLAARESSCCSFFEFAVAAVGADVVIDVRVPIERVPVLDGMADAVG